MRGTITFLSALVDNVFYLDLSDIIENTKFITIFHFF